MLRPLRPPLPRIGSKLRVLPALASSRPTGGVSGRALRRKLAHGRGIEEDAVLLLEPRADVVLVLGSDGLSVAPPATASPAGSWAREGA